jgi:hypothetical protein
MSTRHRRLVAVLLAVVAAGAVAAPASAQAPDLVVDTTDETLGDDCLPNVAADCRLRDAITLANASSNPDTITFAIPGAPADTHTITLTSPLPEITQPVTIDGYSQTGATENTSAGWASAFAVGGAGSNAVLRIEVDLNDQGVIVISGGNTTLKGLAIYNSPEPIPANPGADLRATIELKSLGGNKILGSLIGLLAPGTAPATPDQNQRPGIGITSGNGNVIGGTTPADRNVISANSGPSQLAGGISIGGGANTVIAGNLIGTNPAGTDTAGNGPRGGIDINGFTGDQNSPVANVMIGGTAPGAGNLISGNTHDANSGAVNIGGAWTTPEVHVLGNRIGTDAAGTAVVGNNSRAGLYTSAPVQIGDSAGHGNLISGNQVGLRLDGTGTSVEGNRIGTNPAGTAALPNAHGIEFRTQDIVIGGTIPGAGNVISGNTQTGLTGEGMQDNQIQGNFIGTNAAGTAAVPNEQGGILLQGPERNTIGGAAEGSDNVISGNGMFGIALALPESVENNDNRVLGNLIGTDAAGTGALGNTGPGVTVQRGFNNVIGRPGEGNLIAHNSGDGVLIAGDDPLPDGGGDALQAGGGNDGNSIRGNSIFSNGGLAIDLAAQSDVLDFAGDGVTANDAGDGDDGNNQQQNFPVVSSALTDGTVSGSLASSPNSAYVIDLYENAACDQSGNGEAGAHLGFLGVTTDGNGNASWSHKVDATVAIGRAVTATATDANGNTSELSACVAAAAPTVQQQPGPVQQTPTPTPQVPQQQQPQAPPPTCRDRQPPITNLKKAGVKVTARAITLSGSSADHRTCPSGVVRVDVSLARVNGRTGVNCRFVNRPNRYSLTARKNCRRPTLFKATGTSKYTFTFKVPLKPGLYRAQSRGTDKAKNKETPKKNRNIVFFEVR